MNEFLLIPKEPNVCEPSVRSLKLREFNAHNAEIIARELPMILISSSNIRFNETAVKCLRLKDGVNISFFQNTEMPGDWFFSETKTGFLFTHFGKKGLGFSSRDLASKIGDTLLPKETHMYCPKRLLILPGLKTDDSIFYPLKYIPQLHSI